jgi:sodium/proline symporter
MSALAIISLLAWGFGYFGMPHIVVRYMSLSKPSDVKVARRVSLVWIVIALTAVSFVGIIGRAYLISQGYVFDGSGGVSLDGVPYNPEHIFITMVGDLFFPLIAGFLFAAVMAAIMSTADSQLLVAASSITNDLLGQRYKMGDEKLMWVSRIVVVMVAIFALILALYGGDNIMGLVSYAWAGFGAAFGPLMILSLYWKRMNKYGAIASMIVGFATVVLWNTFLADTGIYELLPGFVFALIVGVVVALVTPAPSQDIVQEFDDAQVYTEE